MADTKTKLTNAQWAQFGRMLDDIVWRGDGTINRVDAILKAAVDPGGIIAGWLDGTRGLP